MELLHCTALKKVYGKGEAAVCALDGIDLTVPRGEFLAVVGASGSGKSTLLHLLAGVDKPTAGQVCIDGVDVGTLNPTQAALFRRRKVGLVYQFFNLIPTLSVEKNIALPLLLDKRTPDPAFLEELLRTLGLTEKRRALPGQLSGGQQQRVAIARALCARPALLDLLTLCHRNWGQTILLVTHDDTLAAQADRVITLSDGRIVSDRPRG